MSHIPVRRNLDLIIPFLTPRTTVADEKVRKMGWVEDVFPCMVL